MSLNGEGKWGLLAGVALGLCGALAGAEVRQGPPSIQDEYRWEGSPMVVRLGSPCNRTLCAGLILRLTTTTPPGGPGHTTRLPILSVCETTTQQGGVWVCPDARTCTHQQTRNVDLLEKVIVDGALLEAGEAAKGAGTR